jgi:hypothetical protein
VSDSPSPSQSNDPFRPKSESANSGLSEPEILEPELYEPPASATRGPNVGNGPPVYLSPGKPFPWGCLIGGCLGTLLLMVGGLVAVGVGSVWFYNQQIAKYTSDQARELPLVEVTPEELEQLELRVEEFQEKFEQGETPEQLILTADDINALISKQEQLRGRVFVTLDDDLIEAEVSIPASAIPGGKGRYFNGAVTLNASLEDGVLIVTLQDAEVNGQAVPEELMSEIRKENLAKDLYKDPDVAKKLRKFESLVVEGDRIILTPKSVPASGTPVVNGEPLPKTDAE